MRILAARRTDLSQLSELEQHCDFPVGEPCGTPGEAGEQKRLATLIAQQLNVVVNPKSLFDVQIKAYSRIQTSADERTACDHPLQPH